jgi:hypothetical protein
MITFTVEMNEALASALAQFQAGLDFQKCQQCSGLRRTVIRDALEKCA